MSACSTESSPKAQEPDHNDPASATRVSSPASHNGSDTQSAGASVTEDDKDSSPSLPAEEPPPLPSEAPPGQPEDDGWDPIWDEAAQAFYFYNRFTKLSQWQNPRIPTVTEPAPPGVGNYNRIAPAPTTTDPPPTAAKIAAGGYDPAIHGDYDPNADYAKPHLDPIDGGDPTVLHPPGTLLSPAATITTASTASTEPYAATGTFNRFTGKWQAATLNPDNFNDENKSKRQMNAYFDVDAAANSHDGKSLKAERSGKKLTKKELKAFKDKRRERKEEKRRAWLRD